VYRTESSVKYKTSYKEAGLMITLESQSEQRLETVLERSNSWFRTNICRWCAPGNWSDKGKCLFTNYGADSWDIVVQWVYSTETRPGCTVPPLTSCTELLR